MRCNTPRVITTAHMCSYGWGSNSFLNITPPCKDCAERTPGCHGSCTKYDEYKAEIAERKAERKAIGKVQADYRFTRRTILHDRIRW